MSINLYLWQVSPTALRAFKANYELLGARLNGVLKGSISSVDGFRSLYESQGIFSVDDFVAKNRYVDDLSPELRKDALRRIRKVFSTGAKKGPALLALEKSWHGIHYLLSDEVWTGDSPLGKMLMGGTEIGDESCETGYGKPRFHSPRVVKEIVRELPTISQLNERYVPAKMAEAKLYAFNADAPDEEWEYLSHFYEKMIGFFQDAAKNGRAIILFLS